MGYIIKMCVLLLWFALIFGVAHCASIPLNGKKRQRRPKGFGTAKRAVIIGVDGLGGLHLRNVTQKYKTFGSFLEQGSYTTRARGVYPTSSGPCWSTFLTGMGVMEHGVFNNRWRTHNSNPKDEISYSIPPLSGRGLPKTIFTQVKKKDQNLKTAMMFTWAWLKEYAFMNTDVDDWHWGGSVVCHHCSSSYAYHLKDKDTMFTAVENLLKNDPVLTFIHMDAVDAAGHRTCWGCYDYYTALASVDSKIEYLIDALSEANDSSGKAMLNGTLLVVVSDHGGWKSSHGLKPISALVDIPILIRGPSVLKNNSLENMYVSSLDVATTVLNAIGVEKSEFMRGRVLEQIYQ